MSVRASSVFEKNLAQMPSARTASERIADVVVSATARSTDRWASAGSIGILSLKLFSVPRRTFCGGRCYYLHNLPFARGKNV
jgi:hypothetical protein